MLSFLNLGSEIYFFILLYLMMQYPFAKKYYEVMTQFKIITIIIIFKIYYPLLEVFMLSYMLINIFIPYFLHILLFRLEMKI